MVNKKYILLAGLCSATALLTPAFAQETTQPMQSSSQWAGRDMTYRGQGYDVLDTAFVPKNKMEQHQQYLNYQTPFPARPRNMWELGFNVGLANINGDITSKTPFTAVDPLSAMGFGLSLRKAIGYTLSIRAQYNFLNANGIDYRPLGAASAGEVWTDAGYGVDQNVYGNYKFQSHELSLQLVAAINNIKFHKAKNTASLYAFAGPGINMFNVKVATTDANGNRFSVAGTDGDGAMTKDEVKDYREMLKDATYVDYTSRRNKGYSANDERTSFIAPVLVGGVGIQFKLGNRVSLQLENKITYTGLDWLDATEYNPGSKLANKDKDILNYASIGLGFNLGNKNRRVAPLWWVNPLDHVYSEIANPRHMMLPDPILGDDDADGIANQFDKCPDTPAGVLVDSRGCPLDTDQDGVPDYKDKEPLTPTYCQPVDADGIGKCPCPDGCGGTTAACGTIGAGSINFSSNSARLSANAQSQLANLAAQMKANPTCKVVVMGNAGSSKVQQQRSWDRVNAVIEYLSETQSINRNNFIFQYSGATGDVNSVMYRSANDGETGPSMVVPPHPQYGAKN